MNNKKKSILQIIWSAMPIRYIINFVSLDMDILYKGGSK